MPGELSVETSPVARFFDALLYQLQQHPALADTPMYSAPVGRMPGQTETIQLWFADEDQFPHSAGVSRKDNTWVCRGGVFASAKGNNDRELDIKAARNRAFALLGVIEQILRQSVRGTAVFHEDGRATCRHAHLSHISMDQGLDPDLGRWCGLDFDITAEAQTIAR